MELYMHEGCGHYLGSTVIVWAGSFKTARKMIRAVLDKSGLSDEELRIKALGVLGQKPMIIYDDDGNY